MSPDTVTIIALVAPMILSVGFMIIEFCSGSVLSLDFIKYGFIATCFGMMPNCCAFHLCRNPLTRVICLVVGHLCFGAVMIIGAITLDNDDPNANNYDSNIPAMTDNSLAIGLFFVDAVANFIAALYQAIDFYAKIPRPDMQQPLIV